MICYYDFRFVYQMRMDVVENKPENTKQKQNTSNSSGWILYLFSTDREWMTGLKQKLSCIHRVRPIQNTYAYTIETTEQSLYPTDLDTHTHSKRSALETQRLEKRKWKKNKILIA